ncbi:MAG: hypothetical protein A2505_07405 [Deltaproteobacteria bacterium RIFOXYD12_FULL_55_16]|nr:MAG: hypothetical protein A2505_07405 [Deltaproteobacteria bacterium RIFOXYD12_FULL_55_16]
MSLLLLPDLFLLLLGVLVLALDLLHAKKPSASGSFHLSWTGLLLIFALLLALPYDQQFVWLGSYQVSGTSLLCKQLFILSALFTVWLARPYFRSGGNKRGRLAYQGEFYGIIIFASVGMFAVVSAGDLLTLFIGMELATIPLYILAGYHKNDHRASEAAMKYIVMGSLATGFMLFGLSFLYGAAGALDFAALKQAAMAAPASPLLGLGVCFIIAAVGFKLTLFPFHMWAPDVYDGAPTPVTAFIAVSSKATAIIFFLILFHGPLAALHTSLQMPLLLLAGATMTAGNLGALRQTRLRRFMGYSAIAQAGYLTMALVGPRAAAWSSILYYLLVYAAANFAAFFLIAIVGRDREEEFSSLRGMGKQNPGLAAVLMLTMFSLGGIPPLAGFLGKFLLFAAAAQQGYYAMVVFAALNSTISLYYYLLLVKEAYINEASEARPMLTVEPLQRTCLALLTTAMILLGLWPGYSDFVVTVLR